MPKIFRALGAMSGTSMDGIDLALLETDGRGLLKFGPTASFAFSDADRALLRAAVAAARNLNRRDERPGPLAEAESLITQRHLEAVATFLRDEDISPAAIDLIGFHGQTVLHRPEQGLTVQLGDGALFARRAGIDVVYDMRAADLERGGQGAPLVPVYHAALAESCGFGAPMLFVNIGGVANVTFCAPGAAPLACDVGPGNALLDDLMLARAGRAMDADGAAARAGRVDEAALAALLAHPWFARKPPKSLDRNAFDPAPVAGLSLEDAAATLCAFTAAGIVSADAFVPAPPQMIVLCGGGARNPALVEAISARAPCPVRRAENFGWDSQAIEAQAFAYLAARSAKGLPLTFPGTTGVREPATGGKLAWAG
ncbi:anhydro-N-acetylmuramic acid kinase [Rhodoblastus sphagnicola]|uniref:Anhydro-N-acetylmuramic acid kinase n=1 Tax=Rhodoblastus sphagnicola TaxID=333368 RepID=A0A2S6NGQ5_9HYPH|nr:anhydro-N-acetylmuramic acid kinase [Rhodoblastus sphagnicola]MBB4196581.1 anhydro-N-acetylmuramic acid kinase [Rhodoblastus sphagnicola]PPQ33786.1 anhydro-N-acetylmuramic acid kinase [Rhodoblastus sphagnicola]